MSHSPLALRTEIAALLPRLRRFARTVTPRREDADDLVRTAVERALHRPELWQDGTRLDTWLFRIMKNAWVDGAAAQAGGVTSSDTGDRIAPPSLEAAMARLPEDERLAVGLVLGEGLPYQDAAQVLDIPIAALASQLARGRDALLQGIGDGRIG